MEGTFQGEGLLTERGVAAELHRLVGGRGYRDTAARYRRLRLLQTLRSFAGLGTDGTDSAIAAAIEERLGAVLAGDDPAEDDVQVAAVRKLVRVSHEPKAADRRLRAAPSGMPADTFRRNHEESYLLLLARRLLAAHTGRDHSRALPPVAFPRWLSRLTPPLRSSTAPTVGPGPLVRATLGEANVLYVVPDPLFKPQVELVLLAEPSPPDLTSELAGAHERRRIEIEALPGKNKAKVSVDSVALPELDTEALVIAYHPELWSVTKAMHDVLPQLRSERSTLAERAADLSKTTGRWPSALTLHGIVTFRQGKQDFVVWSQRRDTGQLDNTYEQGSWSCSFEEQLVPSQDYKANARRSLGEELVGHDEAKHLDAPLLAVLVEQALLNFGLVSWTRWPKTWTQFLEAYGERDDPHELWQVAATPLDRELLRAFDLNGNFTAARRVALFEDRQMFDDTTCWKLHPTSLLRYAIALWALEQTAEDANK